MVPGQSSLPHGPTWAPGNPLASFALTNSGKGGDPTTQGTTRAPNAGNACAVQPVVPPKAPSLGLDEGNDLSE